MLGETLDNGATDHNDGTGHDAPPAAILLVKPWGNRNSNNRTELVAGRNKAEQSRLDLPFAIFVLIPVAEI